MSQSHKDRLALFLFWGAHTNSPSLCPFLALVPVQVPRLRPAFPTAAHRRGCRGPWPPQARVCAPAWPAAPGLGGLAARRSSP